MQYKIVKNAKTFMEKIVLMDQSLESDEYIVRGSIDQEQWIEEMEKLQVRNDFYSDLNELLNKHNASLSIDVIDNVLVEMHNITDDNGQIKRSYQVFQL